MSIAILWPTLHMITLFISVIMTLFLKKTASSFFSNVILDRVSFHIQRPVLMASLFICLRYFFMFFVKDGPKFLHALCTHLIPIRGNKVIKDQRGQLEQLYIILRFRFLVKYEIIKNHRFLATFW